MESIKGKYQYDELKQALEAIKELGVPEHLQKTALEHLLADGGSDVSIKNIQSANSNVPKIQASSTQELRAFVSSLGITGAVKEIPCLIFWAKENEGKEIVDENSVVELYRRAGLRPPKNVAQSLRDLASKKYGRLEAVKDQPGYVKLSRVGEDFVIHDVIAESK